MNLSVLSDQIAQQDFLEWIGLLTGIAYVVLAAYEHPSCWIFGIISSAAIAIKSFTDYMLIADGLLQVFYIVIGVVGLFNWINGRIGQHEKPITISPVTDHLVAIALCLVISIPLSWLLIHYASARYGYIDTAITLLSVWATILLVQKELYNWVYWIILDVMLVWLYYISGGYLFALLLLIYTIIAVWGFLHWRQQVKVFSPGE